MVNMAKHIKTGRKDSYQHCPFFVEERKGCRLRKVCEIHKNGKPCILNEVDTFLAEKISTEMRRAMRGDYAMLGTIIRGRSHMQDRSDVLLKWQRDAGYALREVNGFLLLTTRRTSSKKIIAAFPLINNEVPQKAIWVACDLDDQRTLVDYEAIDCIDFEIRDRLEHGTFRPNPDSPAIVRGQ